MTEEEHKIKLDAFIKAYNELEEFKKDYITNVLQTHYGSTVSFTIPTDPVELEKFIQLNKALDKARKELSAEVS